MRSFPGTNPAARMRPAAWLLASAAVLCGGPPPAAGAVAGPAASRPGVPVPPPGISVKPRQKVYLSAWVEYQPSDCTLISSGAWTINKPPKYGRVITEILNSTLGNGDCPGVIFPFAALYYRWPGGEGAGKTDYVAATWKAPDYTYHESYDLDLVRPIPINFAQDGPARARAHGVLHFNYKWESSTGDLADLADCQIGELVDYPSSQNPFVWPKPPYDGSTPNPTILWVAAQDGAAQDNHSHTDFKKPYRQSRFRAKQNYRYQCPAPAGTVNFDGWTDILITREVHDSTGRGCWGYTITKTGASASEAPMPGVKAEDCTPAKPGPAYASSNSAAELALSAAPASGPVSLHEPVHVDLKLSNRTDHDARADLGLNRTANLRVAVRAPDGHVESSRLPATGFGRSGEFVLPAGGSVTERLLLDDWYVFARPGTYAVSITLMGPGSDRPKAQLQLQVLPRDPARLRQVAAALAARALDPDAGAADHAAAARALGRIADPLAVPALVQLLQHGPTLEAYAISGLARIRTPQALAALADAARSHPDPQVRSAARSALQLIDGSVHSAPEPAD